MTQGLSNIFDLPSVEDILKEKGILTETVEENNENNENEDFQDPSIIKTLELAQQAQARINLLDGTDHADAMDEIYKQTLKHSEDIMDLGFNVEHTRAAKFFESATMMYSRAIEAKNSKRKAQLDAIKLAMEQRKLDMDERRLKHDLGETEKNTIVSEGTIIKEDRNELIRRLRENRRNDL